MLCVCQPLDRLGCLQRSSGFALVSGRALLGYAIRRSFALVSFVLSSIFYVGT